MLDGDDQNNAVLAPLINCHDPGRTVSRENINSGSLNNAFQSTSLSIRSTVQQSVDKINPILTCIHHVPFRGMIAGFFSCR